MCIGLNAPFCVVLPPTAVLTAKEQCKIKNKPKIMFISSCPACSSGLELSKYEALFSFVFATAVLLSSYKVSFFHFSHFLGLFL